MNRESLWNFCVEPLKKIFFFRGSSFVGEYVKKKRLQEKWESVFENKKKIVEITKA